ncbi:hypothetical protein [Massilia sp. SYSU DXS3249]
MSLVAKLALAFCLLFLGSKAEARDIYILVLGDGTAANCHAHPFGQVPGVYQFGPDGREQAAADPLLLADCKGGSIWLPLGEEMIRTGFARKVVFVPIGVSNVNVHDWLQGGRAADRLSLAIKAATAMGVDFDYLLWQGGSDKNLSGEQYIGAVRSFIRMVSLNIKIKKWVIGRGARCDKTIGGPDVDTQLRRAANPIFNRFQGPHTSTLGSEYRTGACTFTEQGQRKMAALWFESIKKADAGSDRYQKESLLHYFR